MPVVFASGSFGRLLFVLKGKSINIGVVKSNGHSVVETIANCLPEGSFVACLYDVAGVDSTKLLSGQKSL